MFLGPRGPLVEPSMSSTRPVCNNFSPPPSSPPPLPSSPPQNTPFLLTNNYVCLLLVDYSLSDILKIKIPHLRQNVKLPRARHLVTSFLRKKLIYASRCSAAIACVSNEHEPPAQHHVHVSQMQSPRLCKRPAGILSSPKPKT